MKLLIDDEYSDVGVFSFLKCSLIVQLVLFGLVILGSFIITFLVLMTEGI